LLKEEIKVESDVLMVGREFRIWGDYVAMSGVLCGFYGVDSRGSEVHIPVCGRLGGLEVVKMDVLVRVCSTQEMYIFVGSDD
jgi:hypothetical protein